MRIEYHRTLIADKVRNEAFYAALRSVVRPGVTTVADIGAGTGLLALFAAKLGAKDVFLYEAAEVSGVAAAVLKRNRARNCHLMPCHSTEIDDPPRVDVVVSETLGNYALEENIVATIADARKRHLKPGGVVIPSRIRQFVAPVTSERIARELAVWDEVGHGIDLSPAKTMSLNNLYVRTLAASELLPGAGGGQLWDDIDLARETRSTRKGEGRWKLARAATIHGFALWWQADLVAGITLSTAPDALRTHWEQLYCPLLEPLRAGAGEEVSVQIRSRSSEAAGTHVAWTAVLKDAKGRERVRQVMDLDKGWLP
jgi:protein arginine N-methyltransferase 1